MSITRDQAVAMDVDDRLAPLREQFVLPEGVIYLDGNSLGALPKTTASRVQSVIANEWGQDLIASWNSAGWIDLPRRTGDQIARLIGARAGEVVVADSTSVNLFKVLSAAVRITKARDPERTVIVSERSNFPTDLYIAQALAEQYGYHLRLVEKEEIVDAINPQLAVLLLTHVNYRTGAMHDMAALSAKAHAGGALIVWDLAHSAGAVPLHVHADDADFVIGCGYKYLNGGPGAPAFVWAHPRWVDRFQQPLSGWMGHAVPFAFETGYLPASGIARYLCGTPAVIAMAALACGVDSVLAAEPYGGMAALRAKSLALTRLFADRVSTFAAEFDLAIVSPMDDALRGSQVSLACEAGGYAIVQALIARGVIGDFRAGDALQSADILRFGFTPLYTRFVDAWDAAWHLHEVLRSGIWRDACYAERHAVT
ncbi:MAG: kynureninase [Xanthomonadales bacterium]|jgi:kynureninase|nr:kynureninase [Xanthomonadales bacterium]